MDIQPTRSSRIGLDPKATEAANLTRTPEASPVEKPTLTPSDNDRVELSDEALTRTEEVQDPVLEQASNVLRDWPSLDPERIEMILARLEDGFYNKSDILKQVAESLYADLTEQPLDAQGAKPQP